VRTLLPHPLRRLIVALATFALTGAVASSAAPLPQSIGNLSDYGAVLDRHGREWIEELIGETRRRFGVDVFILASWENPLSDARSLADALFHAWGLSRLDGTLLAVFVRTSSSWTHAVVESVDLRARSLAARLEAGVADLVEHDRIEEAMVALFDLISGQVEAIAPEAGPDAGETGPRGWLVPAVVLPAACLVWLIHRRVCPRCGRILRVSQDRSARGILSSQHRVYFCRSCGFRREARKGRTRWT